VTLDLTTRCTACHLPLSAHVRADGRVVCRGEAKPGIPDVLTLTQLCTVLSLSPRTVHKRRQNHSHPGIVELPHFVGHPRFSGAAVRDWLAGNHGLRLARRRA
jgi:hypothetical protein